MSPISTKAARRESRRPSNHPSSITDSIPLPTTAQNLIAEGSRLSRNGTPSKDWVRATNTNPCPACGGIKWCMHGEAGGLCNKGAIPNGCHEGKEQAGGGRLWWVEAPASPDDQSARIRPTKPAAPAKATSGQIHRVFSRLLERCPLTPKHLAYLTGPRGLSSEQVTTIRFASLPATGAKREALLSDLAGEFGELLRLVPGFRQYRGKLDFAVSGGGLIIPHRVGEDIAALQVRLDHPKNPKDRYRWLSGAGGPSIQAVPYVAGEASAKPGFAIVTEGAFKALAVSAHYGGALAVGLPGASMAALALPILRGQDIKEVLLVFDADHAEKKPEGKTNQVFGWLRSTVRFLRAEGMTVRLLLWHRGPYIDGETPKGVDDAIHAGADLWELGGDDVDAYLREVAESLGQAERLAQSSPFEVAELAEHVKILDQAAPPAAPLWQDLVPFADQETPPLPSGLMPANLEAFGDAVSHQNQTPRDQPHAILVGVLSAAAQGAWCVKIGQRTENLATAIVIGAETGERKSTDCRSCSQPLHEWEQNAKKAAKAKRLETEAKRQLLESRQAHLKKQAAKGEDGLEAEMASVMRELEELGSSRAPRLVCGDITPEKLGNLCAENGGSIALMDTEGGAFEVMGGKYSSNKREFAGTIHLKLYSGDPIHIDRQHLPPVAVHDGSLTMMNMSQPSHLAGVLADPLFQGRGLLERMTWIFPEPRIGYRETGSGRDIPDNIRERHESTIHRMLPDAETAGRIPRTPIHIMGEGRRILDEFEAWLEPQFRPDGELYEIRGWATRLPTLVAKVSCLWHIYDHHSAAADDDGWSTSAKSPVPDVVAAEWVSRAVQWATEYVIPMGRKVWIDLLGAKREEFIAKQVLKCFAKLQVYCLTSRDILREVRSLNRETLNVALQILEERNYIKLWTETPTRGGRSTEFIELHPLCELEGLAK